MRVLLQCWGGGCLALGVLFGFVNTLHMFGVEFGRSEPEPGMAFMLIGIGLIALYLGRQK